MICGWHYALMLAAGAIALGIILGPSAGYAKRAEKFHQKLRPEWATWPVHRIGEWR